MSTGTAALSEIAHRERVHTAVDSPIGPLLVVAQDGAVCRLDMLDDPDVEATADVGVRDDAMLVEARAQLAAYFAGQRRTFDLPLRLEGTDFQRRVWAALQEIPYGETVSYGELAARLGSPGASRAVGLANGRNPVAVIVPCHRVIAADGTLGGYGGGLERKRRLLDLEQVHAGHRLL
jgi:methylated-DNA-[protein]-cysteine S-methyltransferase